MIVRWGARNASMGALFLVAWLTCRGRSLEEDPLSSLRALAPSGVAVVVQSAECESRASELRLLARELPGVPVLHLEPISAPTSDRLLQLLDSLFPRSTNPRVRTTSAAALANAGVASTPSLLAWADSSTAVEVQALRADQKGLRQLVRWARARHPRTD